MNLIIDIGNSYTKFALTESGKIVYLERFEKVTVDVLDHFLDEHPVTKSIIAATGLIDEDVYQPLFLQTKTIRMDSSTRIPIINKYSTPKTLGSDRIALAVGASSLYHGDDLLIVDCGTAITYDLINRNKEYLGGAISPGLRLRFESLNANTANLPLIDIETNYPLIGNSTKDCILSGVLNGAMAEVDSYILRVKNDYPNIKTLITGGDANFFAVKLKNSIFVVHNLIVNGLNTILEFNT